MKERRRALKNYRLFPKVSGHFCRCTEFASANPRWLSAKAAYFCASFRSEESDMARILGWGSGELTPANTDYASRSDRAIYAVNKPQATKNDKDLRRPASGTPGRRAVAAPSIHCTRYAVHRHRRQRIASRPSRHGWKAIARSRHKQHARRPAARGGPDGSRCLAHPRRTAAVRYANGSFPILELTLQRPEPEETQA